MNAVAHAGQLGDPVPRATLDWLAEAVGGRSRILSIRLMGRGSTEKHAVDVRGTPAGVLRLVLRRYVDLQRLAVDPWYRPAQEVEALRILEDDGIPAPRVIAADTDGLECDVPALLETRMAGLPLRRPPADMRAYLAEAAAVLVRIHAIDPARAQRLPVYARYADAPPQDPTIPAWSSRPSLWESALARVEATSGPTERRFIHRDYHPGNILRSRGRVTSVVDWPTACRGPRGIDLARMRLILASDFGLEHARSFLTTYEGLAGSSYAHDPTWDLVDATDAILEARGPRTRADAARWERFERWVAAAASSGR